MCNIAGYVGTKNAASVLIEMIRIQEGLGGGFFTGLATHDGTALQYRKLEGELADLLHNTDAASLPGNMGIAHSRTPSGGDGSWAHPFASERNGSVELCYVANGAIGRFKHQNERYNQIADQLIADGFDIPCKLNFPGEKYNKLSTGEAVHMSDVMCQLIYRHKTNGLDTADAMAEAFMEMPSEIVGLSVDREHPDRIFFSRINQPMFVGFDDSGAYLATSPMAFPSQVKTFELLPPLSSGTVFKDHFVVKPFREFPVPVAPIDDAAKADAVALILRMLQTGKQDISSLSIGLRDTLPTDRINQVAPLIYTGLTELLNSKKIQAIPSRRIVENGSRPKTYFELLSF